MSRLLFVLSFGLMILVSCIGVLIFFLDIKTRLLVLMVGSLPPASFVLAHALLEFNQPFRVVRKPILILSLFSLALLLMPTVFVLCRHILFPVDSISTATSVALVLFALLLAPALRPFADGLPDPTGLLPLLARVAEHVRAVMWDFRLEGAKVLDHEYLPRHRGSALIDKNALKVFQETLTTPERDSATACASLSLLLPKEITILDIGGGDGTFSCFLTSCLGTGDRRVVAITVVDPVDWNYDYREKFKGTAIPEITYRRQRFADYDTTDRFDLVVASHSFYGECNVPPGERLDRLRQVLLRFLAYRKDPGGVALVVLASGFGKSYEFKRHALATVLGQEMNDLVAEDLDGLFTTLDLPRQSWTVDNLIRLENLISEAVAGSPERLGRWLEYFLRIPSLQQSVSPDVFAELLELLLGHTQAFSSLPEMERRSYTTLRSVLLSGQDRVLCHKTRIWILST